MIDIEDGTLTTCGICAGEVYMLDADEQDWICDPCSLDGWSGFKSAWRLCRGDVIHRGGKRLVVRDADEVGRNVIVGVTDSEGRQYDLLLRNTDKVYKHMDRV